MTQSVNQPPTRPGRAPRRAPAGWTRDAIEAAAAYGVPGARPIPRLTTTGSSSPDRLDQLDGTELIALAERQRVLGLLAAAVADDPGAPLDELSRTQLVEIHERWCVHDLRLERQLLRAADLLDEASIPFVVLKGPACSHQWYDQPGLRLFADIDLLVPSGRLHDATRVLGAGLGAAAALPELRPGFNERFGKESLLNTSPAPGAPRGFEIDVHRTLVGGALGLVIPLDELFDQPGSVTIGGRPLPALGLVPGFLAACQQATIADVPPRLSAARDVVQMLRSGLLDLDDTVAAASRWQARAVMAEAINWAWPTLGPSDRPALVTWAASYRPTRRERLLLASHRTTGYVYWRQLAAVLVLPGIEPRARYLAATLAPQASYLDGRQWTFLTHLRIARRALSRPVREPAVRAARRFRRRYWLPH